MTHKKFCEKITEYQKQAYAVAYSILQNETEASDAVANAIEIAFKKTDQLKALRKFKAWFLTIVKNEALQIRRKRLDLPGDDNLESKMPPVYDVYDELWDVLQKLPEEFRIVIVMYYYADMSIREIAKALDVPVGTVKSRMNRGKKQLKQLLGEGGIK